MPRAKKNVEENEQPVEETQEQEETQEEENQQDETVESPVDVLANARREAAENYRRERS